MTTLPEWLGAAAAHGLEKQALPRSVISAMKWLAKKPISRGLLLPAGAYYGAEAASAPWASNKTMRDMRENYWGSVAQSAGDTAAKGGQERMMDWLTRPTRAFLAGGENSSVPNRLVGKNKFIPSGVELPGKYDAATGATNRSQVGSMRPELSQYQRAQQALARQAAKAREQALQEALQKADNTPGWFGPSHHAATQQTQQNYQQAFPGLSIPDAFAPKATTPAPKATTPAATTVGGSSDTPTPSDVMRRYS